VFIIFAVFNGVIALLTAVAEYVFPRLYLLLYYQI